MITLKLICRAAALTVVSATALHAQAARTTAAADSVQVLEVVNRFHAALAAADSSAALALLAEDAMILESGGLETREEYRSHHLPGDIAFAKAITSVREPRHVRIAGDVAWVISASTTQGTYRDRAINSAGAELMLLVRRPDGWKIAAIHWSARQRRGS